MRAILLGLALSLLAVIATAQDRGIEAVISDQLEAFEAEDVERAFTHASPNIQRLFQNPRNFGAMVEGGYPMVWRPGEVRFLEQREIAGYIWQRVMITDAAGVPHFLDYQMVQVDGRWRINGVQILKPPPGTA